MEKVLILDGDIRKTLAVVRGLKYNFINIVAHYTPFPLAAKSKYCHHAVLINYNKGFQESLLDIITKYQVNFLIATQEETILKVNDFRELIEAQNVIITFPGKEIIDYSFDKLKTLRKAEELKLPVPKYINKDVENLDDIIEYLDFPIVVKPRRSIFIKNEEVVKTRGPLYVSSKNELIAALRTYKLLTISDYIFQEYINGNGKGAFYLLDTQQNTIATFAHSRIHDVNPLGSGSSLRKSTIVGDSIDGLAQKLLKSIQWPGIAMVEFRIDNNTGVPYLMEINGRFWGSLALAIECGVNFPELLISAYSSKPNHIAPIYLNDYYLRWELGELLRFARIMKGKPKNYPGYFPSRWQGLKELLSFFNPSIHNEVFKWYDPKPFFFEIIQGIKGA